LSATWKDWGLSAWNAKLFDFFFKSEEVQIETPITRLNLDAEVLAQIAGAQEHDSADVEGAFLNLFRKCSMTERGFRRLYKWNHIAKGLEDPPVLPHYFVQLALTLLVASVTEDTAEEGNFRERLRIILQHPPGTSYLPFNLALMWQALESWLTDAHQKGLPYRLLELPSPGHETLIGHSKRLVFPGHRDYTRLAAILGRFALSSDSLPSEIIRAIGTNRPRFSRRFLAEFDDFVSSVHNRASCLFRHPIWTAIERIAWEPKQDESKEEEETADLELELLVTDPIAPELFLLSSQPSMELPEGDWRPLQMDIDAMRFYASNGDPTLAALAVFDSLMQGGADQLLQRSVLKRCIREGCICFCESEDGRLLGVPYLPNQGAVTLIYHEQRLPSLASECEASNISIPLATLANSSWRVAPGLPAAALLAMAEETGSSLNGLTCVVRPIRRPPIQLVDAIRCSGAFLFRFPALPKVACMEAEELQASWQDDQQTAQRCSLIQSNPSECEGSQYAFPESAAERIPLPGRVHILAKQARQLLNTRAIDLTRMVPSVEYKQPSRPEGYLIEGGTGHMATFSSAETIHHPTRRIGTDGSMGTVNESVLRIPHTTLIKSRPSEAEQCLWKPRSPGDMPPAWSDFFEILAGRSLTRQGLDEGTFISLAKAVLCDGDVRAAWDAMRSLAENGFIDRLTLRGWRGKRIILRKPLILHSTIMDVTVATVTGVVPELHRHELEERGRQLGLKVSQKIITEGVGIGPIMLSSTGDHAVIGELAERMHWQKAVLQIRESDLHDRDAPFAVDALLQQASGKGEPEVSFWHWQHCRFVSEEPDEHEVVVRRISYGDRPDDFAVTQGDSRWVTRSRNWALLAGYALRSEYPFVSASGTAQRASTQEGVYLPLYVGRLISALGGVAGRSMAGGTNYLYACDYPRLLKRILSPFLENGPTHEDTLAIDRWRHLCAQRSPRGRRIQRPVRLARGTGPERQPTGYP
jgi:hypothetical protein